MKPVFLLDPLLLPNLLHTCPVGEYESLFEVIPPYYGVARLAFDHKQNSQLTVDDVSMYLMFMYLIC